MPNVPQWKCQTCHAEFNALVKYNTHQKVHKYLSNCTFKCFEEGCYKQFRSYKTFYMHIYRYHVNFKSRMPQDAQCKAPNCSYRFKSKRLISSHVSQHIKNGDEVNCPFKTCKQVDIIFRNISTWRSHLFRKHFNENSTNFNTENVFNIEDLQQIGENETISLDGNDTNMDSLPVNDYKTELSTLLSTLFLKLQSKYFLTDKALNAIIEGFNDATEISNQHLISVLLESYNINISTEKLNELNLFNKAHCNVDSLQTPFLRKKYYKKVFKFVAPECISLGKYRNTERFFFYIPILKTLDVLLQNKNVLNRCLSPSNEIKPDNILSDFTDGLVFKNNSFFREHPTCLKIIMFQDAFELCNPLGSSRKKHKIVGIYMILGNLHSHTWSKVDNILLVALAKTTDIEHFGIDAVFDAVVKDLKILEEIGIIVDGHNFKGSLFAMLGDNLGSHQIGGFCENFSTTPYICRYCYIEKKNIEVTKSDFNLRSKELYELDVDLQLITNKNHYKGIKRRSILNSLSNYHVCAPGLPPCLAHDILEGVVQYDLMLGLNDLMRKESFTIDVLNSSFKKLKICDGSINFPNFKEKCEKLPGTAHENLLILQLLPFAISELINDNTDSTWQMILLLRKICNILISIKLSLTQVAYLKSLVNEYIEIRVKLFPNVNLRPKHHYMLHYPYLIRQFGPLRHLWTLRFESKHKYFKNIVKHCPNFRNVLYSLSDKHQMLQALQSSQPSAFEDKVYAENISILDDTYSQDVYTLAQQKINNELLFICTCASYRGIKYTKKSFLCYGRDIFGDFLILKVRYIIIDKNYTKIFFIGSSLKIVYNEFTGLYNKLENFKEETIGCFYEELLQHEPLYTTTINQDNVFYFKADALCE